MDDSSNSDTSISGLEVLWDITCSYLCLWGVANTTPTEGTYRFQSNASITEFNELLPPIGQKVE